MRILEVDRNEEMYPVIFEKVIYPLIKASKPKGKRRLPYLYFLSIWIDTEKHKGFTRPSLRFYLFDDNWPEFKKPIDRVDEEYEEIV